jgi:hypothetical protein
VDLFGSIQKDAQILIQLSGRHTKCGLDTHWEKQCLKMTPEHQKINWRPYKTLFQTLPNKDAEQAIEVPNDVPK